MLEDSGLYKKIFKPKKISETCIQERQPSYFEFVILMALLYLVFLALPSVIKIIIIASVSRFWIAKRIYKKGD